VKRRRGEEATAVAAFRSPVHLFTCSPLPSPRCGFTLIELLITLTLVAVISGGITMALSTSLGAFTGIRRRAEIADRWRVVTRRLQADLQGAWLRRGSATTWFQAASPDATGTTTVSLPSGNLLSLTTARTVSADAIRLDDGVGGQTGPQSDVVQVSWWLEQGPDGTQELVRRERTPPDAEADETQDPSATRTVVAQGIRQITLRFFDGTQWVQEWDTTAQSAATDTATSPAGLPQVAEVTLVFDEEGPSGSVGESGPRSLDTADAPRLTLEVALPQPLDPPPPTQ
jgi:prepilin-type N-terminal cleavage/methylation domain-containing protein